MGDDQGERDKLDDLDHFDLVDKLAELGWGISKGGAAGGGQYVVTFRRGNGTADFPEMETRRGDGTDEDDAIRTFIRQLKDEQGSG